MPAPYAILAGLAGALAAGAPQSAVPPSAVEEIFVVRSVRDSRRPPSDFCSASRIGFERAAMEDRFTLRSIASRPSDGRVVNTSVQTVGSIHACFGTTDNPSIINFYGEGALAGTRFSGIGECHSVKADFPEPGLAMHRCFLELRGLPAEYVGGHLTANTVISRATTGPDSDPPGYAQSSIATVRLWKRR